MPLTLPPSGVPDGRPAEAHQLLGRQLRYFRELRGWTVSTAAPKLGMSASKLSRLESGENSIKETDLYRLLEVYQVTGPEQRDAVLRLAWALNNRQWWHQDRGVLGGWFCSYLTLESISKNIRTYEVRFIPGLLQTEEYAEAVIRRRFADPAEVRRRVTARMRRKEAVEASSTALWAVIDVAALEEGFAGASIMSRQIASLIDATRDKNTTIQILPAGAGGGAGIGNSFSLLRLYGEGLPDVVYLEHIDDAQFLDNAGKSDRYRWAMEQLALAACKPRDTEAVLTGALKLLRQPDQ
jgi:transcriptional regulator with XRE-family HTH domain